MLTVHIKPGGQVTVTASGYTGEVCREASRLYLLRQAGGVVSDKPNDEAPLAVAQEERVKQ